VIPSASGSAGRPTRYGAASRKSPIRPFRPGSLSGSIRLPCRRPYCAELAQTPAAWELSAACAVPTSTVYAPPNPCKCGESGVPTTRVRFPPPPPPQFWSEFWSRQADGSRTRSELISAQLAVVRASLRPPGARRGDRRRWAAAGPGLRTRLARLASAATRAPCGSSLAADVLEHHPIVGDASRFLCRSISAVGAVIGDCGTAIGSRPCRFRSETSSTT
jgi:hypothetical protein